MREDRLLKDLFEAEHQRSGIKTLRCLDLDPDFFSDLQQEIQQLTNEQRASKVEEEDHVTNWTDPFGETRQFSLYNTSGDLDDTSTDHNRSIAGKKFHYADKYPTINEFIEAFDHAYNMRLNGMGVESGLSPHEEHTLWRTDLGSKKYVFRCRFHLPIKTNDDVEMYLNGDYYHFDQGTIYFFHNGSIHSARNGGETFRYHLVWDMLLTEETYQLMFSEDTENLPPFLNRVSGEKRWLESEKQDSVDSYEISGAAAKLYEALQLNRLGIEDYKFNNKYTDLMYRLRRNGRLGFITDIGREIKGPVSRLNELG